MPETTYLVFMRGSGFDSRSGCLALDWLGHDHCQCHVICLDRRHGPPALPLTFVRTSKESGLMRELSSNSKTDDILSMDCRREKNRAHHKYKKNAAMKGCLVKLYSAWRQSVIAIFFLYFWCAPLFSTCSPSLVYLGPEPTFYPWTVFRQPLPLPEGALSCHRPAADCICRYYRTGGVTGDNSIVYERFLNRSTKTPEFSKSLYRTSRFSKISLRSTRGF